MFEADISLMYIYDITAEAVIHLRKLKVRRQEDYAFRHIMFIARMMDRVYVVPLGTKSIV
jgi:hypothetical protein